MPRGPYSTASARVSPSMAALAVTYGVQPGTACRAWCEETLTIAPCVPDARKRRIAVAHPTTAGLRFIAMNLNPAVVGCATAIRSFLASGTHGAIVNVSSHQARQAVP